MGCERFGSSGGYNSTVGTYMVDQLFITARYIKQDIINYTVIVVVVSLHAMVMSDQCACAGNTDRRFSGVVDMGPRYRTIESHRL